MESLFMFIRFFLLRLLNFSSVILVLLPPIFGLLFVYRYGVNAISWDEYEYVLGREKLGSVVYNITPHNEHIILFQNILYYFVRKFFDWNSKASMYLVQILILLIYVCCYLLIKDNANKLSLRDKFVVFCIGVFLYNTSQITNLLWTYGIAWFLAPLLCIISFIFFKKAVSKNSVLLFLISMFFAVAGSLSSFWGLSVWAGYLSLLVMCSVNGEIKSFNRTWLFATLATCLLCFSLYFAQIDLISEDNNKQRILPSILNVFVGIQKILFAVFGSPKLQLENIFEFIILVILQLQLFVCIIKILLEKRVLVYSTQICSVFMSLCSVIFIVLGRTSLCNDTIASRYTTPGCIFFAVSFILLYNYYKKNPLQIITLRIFRPVKLICILTNRYIGRFSLFIGITTFFVLTNIFQVNNRIYYETSYIRNLHLKVVEINYDSVPLNYLSLIHPGDLLKIKNGLSFLRRFNLNCFSDSDSATLRFKQDFAIPNDILENGIFISSACIKYFDSSLVIEWNDPVLLNNLSNYDLLFRYNNRYSVYAVLNNKKYKLFFDRAITERFWFSVSMSEILSDNSLKLYLVDNKTKVWSGSNILHFLRRQNSL